MRLDSRGLAVTCGGDAELGAIEAFSRCLLRLEAGAEAVLGAAERFPETPLLQLHAAAAYLFAQTAAGDRAAAPFLARAAALARAAQPREERYRQALVAWHRHAFSEAAATLEALTAEWPGDLAAAKIAEFLYYVLGQEHEGARFRRHMERLAERHAEDADFLAMLAFARELTGDVDLARATAERALALAPWNPWADHALSHVWLRQGAIEPAIAHLSAAQADWANCNRVIACHDQWHLALHYLERLDLAAAEALLDRAVWLAGEDLVGSAIDTIALLWRLEMAGRSADARWPTIADRVEAYLEPCFMPFLAAHWAYALARAGRSDSLARLLAAVARQASQPEPDAERAWTRVGRATVEACAAFSAGDARRCVRLLEPVIDEVTVGGGSDAQCDLFRITFVRALAASGRTADAHRFLDRRLGGRPATPLDDHWRSLAG